MHDFTKGLDESNWTLLPPHPSPLTPPTEGDLDGVDVSFASEESIVPYSMGTGQQPDGKEVGGIYREFSVNVIHVGIHMCAYMYVHVYYVFLHACTLYVFLHTMYMFMYNWESR